MKIFIKNGTVVDPSRNLQQKLNVLIDDAKIVSIDTLDHPADEIINAENCIVLPGLIDMHVHFREPGGEAKETILGGSQVAAKSGFTSVCTMPNTNPPIDNQALVKFIKLEAEKGPINIFPVAAISKGLKGEEISEMGDLHTAGAVAFSDDGKPVMSSLLLLRALDYSRMFNVPLLLHEEDTILADSGIMNEGVVSTKLGIKGIPAEAEEIMIARDALLAKKSNARIHIQHLSSGASADIVKHAKSTGVKITCETAPHYFSLTDEAILEHLSMAKMNPPLRTENDRKKIIAALKDGTIDVIATDHAPHTANEKKQELEFAPFGIIGLETAVPLIITKLVIENGFSYCEAFSKVTCNPANILNLDKGVLQEGKCADITIVNPTEKVNITDDYFLSKCKNSPFKGSELFGKVMYTICGGKIVYGK